MPKDRTEYFSLYWKNTEHKKKHILAVNKYNMKNIKNGMCHKHPDRPIVSKWCCQECLNKMVNRNLIRKKQGICKDCSNSSAPNRSRCYKCLFKELLRHCNLTDIEATKILEKQNYTCPISGRKLIKGINASPDHIIHQYKGGTHDPSNIRFVDIRVQQARHTWSDEVLFNLVKDIYKYQKF